MKRARLINSAPIFNGASFLESLATYSIPSGKRDKLMQPLSSSRLNWLTDVFLIVFLSIYSLRTRPTLGEVSDDDVGVEYEYPISWSEALESFAVMAIPTFCYLYYVGMRHWRNEFEKRLLDVFNPQLPNLERHDYFAELERYMLLQRHSTAEIQSVTHPSVNSADEFSATHVSVIAALLAQNFNVAAVAVIEKIYVRCHTCMPVFFQLLTQLIDAPEFQRLEHVGYSDGASQAWFYKQFFRYVIQSLTHTNNFSVQQEFIINLVSAVFSQRKRHLLRDVFHGINEENLARVIALLLHDGDHYVISMRKMLYGFGLLNPKRFIKLLSLYLQGTTIHTSLSTAQGLSADMFVVRDLFYILHPITTFPLSPHGQKLVEFLNANGKECKTFLYDLIYKLFNVAYHDDDPVLADNIFNLLIKLWGQLHEDRQVALAKKFLKKGYPELIGDLCTNMSDQDRALAIWARVGRKAPDRKAIITTFIPAIVNPETSEQELFHFARYLCKSSIEIFLQPGQTKAFLEAIYVAWKDKFPEPSEEESIAQLGKIVAWLCYLGRRLPLNQLHGTQGDFLYNVYSIFYADQNPPESNHLFAFLAEVGEHFSAWAGKVPAKETLQLELLRGDKIYQKVFEYFFENVRADVNAIFNYRAQPVDMFPFVKQIKYLFKYSEVSSDIVTELLSAMPAEMNQPIIDGILQAVNELAIRQLDSDLLVPPETLLMSCITALLTSDLMSSQAASFVADLLINRFAAITSQGGSRSVELQQIYAFEIPDKLQRPPYMIKGTYHLFLYVILSLSNGAVQHRNGAQQDFSQSCKDLAAKLCLQLTKLADWPGKLNEMRNIEQFALLIVCDLMQVYRFTTDDADSFSIECIGRLLWDLLHRTDFEPRLWQRKAETFLAAAYELYPNYQRNHPGAAPYPSLMQVLRDILDKTAAFQMASSADKETVYQRIAGILLYAYHNRFQQEKRKHILGDPFHRQSWRSESATRMQLYCDVISGLMLQGRNVDPRNNTALNNIMNAQFQMQMRQMFGVTASKAQDAAGVEVHWPSGKGVFEYVKQKLQSANKKDHAAELKI